MTPIRVALLRGAFLNRYEGQQFGFLPKRYTVTGFSSWNPLDDAVPFPIHKLLSWYDIGGSTRVGKFFYNRVVGDSHFLMGLEQYFPQFTILHTADPHYGYSYQAALWRAKHPATRLVSTVWETKPHNNESVDRKKRLKKFTISQIDMFLCPTKRAQTALIEDGADPRRIRVIPIGIDLTRFSAIEQNKPNDPIRNLLFVGRLVPEKGILDVFDAFLQLVRRHPTLTLTIVGDGPLRDTLHARIIRDDLSRSISVRSVPYADMHTVYHESDILIAPSCTTSTWEEQFGMVLIEAMACGLPIITTGSGAIPEVVGNAAITVAEHSPSGIYNSIELLIKNPLRRHSLSRIALHRATARYDARKNAQTIAALYEKVIQ